MFFYILFGTYKYYLAGLINNNTVLISDGMNCLLNAISIALFSLAMFINYYYYVWYLSSIFGILVGLFTFGYGCYLLMKIFYWRDMDILITGFIP